MEFQASSLLHLLIIVSPLLFSLAKSESSGSVFFIDGWTPRYLRAPPNDAVRADSMSPQEVGAAVSVLLGFAPPASLSAASSSKLNEVLRPNPFDRPRAVLMLEVTGVKGTPFVVDPANSIFSSAIKRKVVLDSDKAHIELPGEEIAVVSLDDKSTDETDKELSEFASWFGGSYVTNAMEALTGELTLPFASGASLTLHMSKEADRQFIISLLALFCNAQRAIKMHKDLSQGTRRPAELIMGCFDGIKSLEVQYGSDDVLRQGMELLLVTVSKLFASLQEAYRDQIVGVILLKGAPYSELETLFNVMLTSWSSARLLAEAPGSPNATNTTKEEAALVRSTLAWVTGIILLISTLLGIYLLLNMPLTRDTLLYSNVKLD